jgi:sRNA-binding protein
MRFRGVLPHEHVRETAEILQRSSVDRMLDPLAEKERLHPHRRRAGKEEPQRETCLSQRDPSLRLQKHPANETPTLVHKSSAFQLPEALATVQGGGAQQVFVLRQIGRDTSVKVTASTRCHGHSSDWISE